MLKLVDQKSHSYITRTWCQDSKRFEFGLPATGKLKDAGRHNRETGTRCPTKGQAESFEKNEAKYAMHHKETR